MTNVPHHPLWIERPDARLTAVGHSEARAAAGHVIYSQTTGHYSHLVPGRHGRLECWLIQPEHLHRFGLHVGPATS